MRLGFIFYLLTEYYFKDIYRKTGVKVEIKKQQHANQFSVSTFININSDTTYSRDSLIFKKTL